MKIRKLVNVATITIMVLIIGIVIWGCGVNKEKSTSKEETSISAKKQDSISKLSFNRPLVVHFPTYGGYAPGILYNRGLRSNNKSLFLKKHNLKVDLIVLDVVEIAVSAFVKGGAGGGVDVMSVTLDMYAATYRKLKEAGLDTVAILLTSWSYGGDAIAVSKDIQSAEDLKNKKIACANITPSHYLALYVLNEASISNEDVNWVFTGTAIDAANVFKAGKTDACVSWAPDVYRAAEGREGGHILTSTKDTGRLIGDIFIVKREFAEKYKDVLAHFCEGWLEGVEMSNEKPDKAVEYLTEAFKPAGIGVEEAKYMISLVQFADKNENLRFFGVIRSESDISYTYRSVYNSSCTLWKKFGVVDAFSPVENTYFVKHFTQLSTIEK